MASRISHALAAQFLGTFALVFVGAGAAALGGAGLVGVALAHGLTVMVFVYAYGHEAGSHLNPAVTLGVWAAGRMDARRALSYVVFQLAGGVAAGYALLGLLGGPVGRLGAGVLARNLPVGSDTVAVSPAAAWFLEALLAFLLANAVLHCETANRAGNLAGVAIGGTLTLNILVGGPLTGAIFNPARQLGPALAAGQFDHLGLYLVAPLVGGLVAAGLFRLLPEK
jgi:MIP family channel proteins